MAERVPLGGRGSYPSTEVPSNSVVRDSPPTVSRSAFKPDRVTHSACDPVGHDGPKEWQYRHRGDRGDQGPKLDRAVPRQTTYDDGTHGKFGAIGSGAEYGTEKERKGQWSSKTGKSYLSERRGSDSFSSDDDESYARRHGGGGLGKSG